jgi:hypothetical protein
MAMVYGDGVWRWCMAMVYGDGVWRWCMAMVYGDGVWQMTDGKSADVLRWSLQNHSTSKHYCSLVWSPEHLLRFYISAIFNFHSSQVHLIAQSLLHF